MDFPICSHRVRTIRFFFNFIVIVLVIILGVNVPLPIIVYGWPLYIIVFIIIFLNIIFRCNRQMTNNICNKI